MRKGLEVLKGKKNATVVPYRRSVIRRLAPLGFLLALLLGAGIAKATVGGFGTVRVNATGSLAPRALPRTGSAAVAVSVDGEISTTDGSAPPTLKQLVIEINRHGQLDPSGLPVCEVGQIQPASNSRALKSCGRSLVGKGKFFGTIKLPGQEPYPMSGKLLVFNGFEHGHPVLLGHIFSPHPFATSFVIPFQISTKKHGNFATTLTANVAKALGNKRNLSKIEMTLSRRFNFRGRRRSFVTAGCPAPKGFKSVQFPLARTNFSFTGGKKVSLVLEETCNAH